jgi:RimJ/RimL family protein N-acetyltransferase
MHRLELTVMAHNQRAIAFYEKCGFIKEGVRRNSITIDRQFIDEIFMARLI